MREFLNPPHSPFIQREISIYAFPSKKSPFHKGRDRGIFFVVRVRSSFSDLILPKSPLFSLFQIGIYAENFKRNLPFPNGDKNGFEKFLFVFHICI